LRDTSGPPPLDARECEDAFDQGAGSRVDTDRRAVVDPDDPMGVARADRSARLLLGSCVDGSSVGWVDALRASRIRAAGLDVFANEPLPADSPFLALPNVVLTPHAAGITPEATEAGLALAIENVFSFLRGQPQNVVV